MFNIVIEIAGSAGFLSGAIAVAVIYKSASSTPWFVGAFLSAFVLMTPLHSIERRIYRRLESKYEFQWLSQKQAKERIGTWFLALEIIFSVITVALVLVGLSRSS
jgi:hypothetical protein